ncbi:MAG TPA: quinone-dependent dihydroorotate dehydrogenase [Saprospiraceae bacterium]|nr:quinone-dependent dihydroorotate dehydrogenase [Saprospiraceae bacterium]
MGIFWPLLRFFFFLFPAETAHHLAMDLLAFAMKIPGLNLLIRNSFRYPDEGLHSKCSGMTARNPIGLAAGFDKDGKWLELLAELGFGHLEVGTVTPRPQSGNPKPRLFRLKKDRSIINRMGFNNAGVEALAERLRAFRKPEGLIIGGNIGKNKDTAEDQAIDDYLTCFRVLFDQVDYFTVNVSSPNTPGLRKLQSREPLQALLSAVQAENQKHPQPKPLFLKIAPDLDETELKDILEVVAENRFAGIIATNTTLDRPDTLLEKNQAKESGGLSGAAITNKSSAVLEFLVSQHQEPVEFIGVGGIMNGRQAIERLNAGAQWIQIYSGMIYEGPWMIRKIKKAIAGNMNS